MVSTMNTSALVEDLKPPTSEQIFMSSITESSTKAGEIFRNDNGQYLFMCFHCYLIFDDFGEITSHCDSHFDYEQKYDIGVKPEEIVFCAEIDPDLDHKLSLPKPPTTLTESTEASKESSELTEHSMITDRRRKKCSMPNVPQNCPICGVWCDDYRAHIRIVHDIHYRIYQCFLCRKYYKNSFVLRKHFKSNHNKVKSACYQCEMEPPVTERSDARRHKCLICKQWFQNHVEFKIHFKEAHDLDADNFFHRRKNCNIFTCYVCEREFPLRDYLVGHMRTHQKDLNHQCPTCGKRVRTFGQLTQHLKTHEGKIYDCEQCHKKFPFYARLRIHRLTHNTEFIHQCGTCSKAFKTRKNLTQHMAVHANTKKFGCRYCPATFNFSSGRRAHEKSQHKVI